MAGALTLGEKQRLFMRLLPRLFDFIHESGYEITGGELWRTPEQAVANAAAGRGVSDSLHVERLAIDINLFKDGVWLKETADHEPIGRYWESLSQFARWGGRFGDGNHYSLTHGGRK